MLSAQRCGTWVGGSWLFLHDTCKTANINHRHINNNKTAIYKRKLENKSITSKAMQYRQDIVTRIWCYTRLELITGCAVAQHCYNGDVRFLWENLELWPPVKFKPLNRLSQNLSQLITSTRGTFVPSLVKIRSRGTSGQIGEMWVSSDFIFFSEACAEIKPSDRFWCMMAQNARNHARMCLFGVKIFNFNIWPLFTPKYQILPPK